MYALLNIWLIFFFCNSILLMSHIMAPNVNHSLFIYQSFNVFIAASRIHYLYTWLTKLNLMRIGIACIENHHHHFSSEIVPILQQCNACWIYLYFNTKKIYAFYTYRPIWIIPHTSFKLLYWKTCSDKLNFTFFYTFVSV